MCPEGGGGVNIPYLASRINQKCPRHCEYEYTLKTILSHDDWQYMEKCYSHNTPGGHNNTWINPLNDFETSLIECVSLVGIPHHVSLWRFKFRKGSGGGRVSEQVEVRGSIPGLATWISEIGYLLLPKSVYGWNTAKATWILNTTNQPTNQIPERGPRIVWQYPQTTIGIPWWQFDTFHVYNIVPL